MPVMFLGLKAKGEAGKTLMSQMSICILQEENIGSLGLIWYANIQVHRPFFFPQKFHTWDFEAFNNVCVLPV